MVRSRTLPSLLAAGALSALVLSAGCGLLSSGGGGDSYFDSQSLLSRRVIFAGHYASSGEGSLSLYTIDVGTSSTPNLYGSGDFDFGGPVMAKDANNQWNVLFGIEHLTLRHAVNGSMTGVTGLGARQMAAAFDLSTPLRFVYMDGSEAGGYNIRYQTGATGTATEVTTDASPTVSYWTPTWSPDGAWIMYAKVTGTTGADAELWRVHPDGTGAEQLPITTTELPTYAVFNPTGTEVFVPGDFTSYKVLDGTPGKFDAMRDYAKMQSDLAAMGYEFVGSALTGPTHAGEYATPVRHAFPISAQWPALQNNRLYFEALVASNFGDPPHEVLGVAVFSWLATSETLLKHVSPMPLSAASTDGYTVSLVHPFIIP